MAKRKSGGFLDKFLLGKEKSEGYARASLPSNRWELYWDILKGSFFKIVGINLLILLFCLPLIFALFFKDAMVQAYGAIYPFSQSFGVGYGALPDVSGLVENVQLQANTLIFILMPVLMLIAALGFAGGAYVMRNMVWTEGIFVANDFWHGIKRNFKQIAIVMVVYGIVFYLTIMGISTSNVQIATNSQLAWLFTISKGISYVILVIFTMMTLHMITLAVTYETSLIALFKNSLLFTIGLFPQSVFFIVLGLIPYFITLLGGIFLVIGVLCILFFGLANFFLIWTNFCQWSYDKFINEKIGVKTNKGIYVKSKDVESGALKQYNQQKALAELAALNRRPVKPITDDELQVVELPTSYTRADLERLNQSKQAIYDDHERYVAEHTVDKDSVLKSEDLLELERQNIEREKRIEKAKKELAKRKNDD